MASEVLQFAIRIGRAIHAGKFRCEEPDLFRLVADTLEVGYRLDDGNDQPQVARRRGACRKNTAALLVDIDLEVVDLVIVVRNLQPEFAVTADDCRDRPRQLRFDESAHAEDRVSQVLDVLVETLRNMIGKFGCFHNDSTRARAGPM